MITLTPEQVAAMGYTIRSTIDVELEEGTLSKDDPRITTIIEAYASCEPFLMQHTSQTDLKGQQVIRQAESALASIQETTGLIVTRHLNIKKAI